MKFSTLTWTGHGLAWARRGEVLAILSALLYLIVGRSERLLLVGFALTGLAGFISVHRLWRGQSEFGPDARRLIRRGVYEFLLAALLFILAFLSFQTFPSPGTGLGFDDNATTPSTTVHRFKDLLPPTVILGLAFTVESVSGATLLWPFLLGRTQRALYAYGASGLVIGAAIFARGFLLVSEWDAAGSGGRAASPSSAFVYWGLYLDAVLIVATVLLVLQRLVALVLLHRALENVVKAENEPMEAEPPSGEAPPPEHPA